MILLRFLIISICVMYIIRSLVRLFLPMLFQSMVNKAQQQHNYSQQRYGQQRPQQPDNRIKVDHMPPAKKSSIPDNEGDFIDYEEVK
ncbi:DUF4834 family protein [Mucilaginibacter daejeonensis]|uniref:DUF4834 family protein n=1 Tax=Mucilaginibacter daejeonensis TaxID=398049 RepID=UPI001D173D35|nr:DUF4834 family protein [Mucilaginibacter daejeonensis]UEG52965.1 DUF4834 family protein [Mucilaginibacter daejeonensis]